MPLVGPNLRDPPLLVVSDVRGLVGIINIVIFYRDYYVEMFKLCIYFNILYEIS